MKTIKLLLLLFIPFNIFSQTKSLIFYNENGEKITREEFIKTKDYRENLDLYFESDSTQIGHLITRKKFGYLDKMTFTKLKTYLTELSGKQIDSTQNIVINYLTAYPKKEENTKSRSTWNLLDRDYPRKLHKMANISQFWISSPQSGNLKYYHHNRINWITDKDNFFKNLFFKYEVRYGNYILIKPDGKFFYRLGEHNKHLILKHAGKFFTN